MSTKILTSPILATPVNLPTPRPTSSWMFRSFGSRAEPVNGTIHPIAPAGTGTHRSPLHVGPALVTDAIAEEPDEAMVGTRSATLAPGHRDHLAMPGSGEGEGMPMLPKGEGAPADSKPTASTSSSSSSSSGYVDPRVGWEADE
jgi:hypothetical protein